MNKKTLANVIMVALIVIIAVAGVLGVGYIQGWFDSNDGTAAVLSTTRGVVTMERDGVAFPAEKNTVLRQNDKITCDAGATAEISIGTGYMTLGDKAQFIVRNPAADGFEAEIGSGEVFVNVTEPVTLHLEKSAVVMEDASAIVSVRTGAQSISVLDGTVEETEKGQILEWVGEQTSRREFQLSSLNNFAISQIRQGNKTRTLCFSNEDLDKLQEERRQQLQEQLNHPDSTIPETTVPETTAPEETTPETENTVPESSESTQTSSNPTSPDKETTKPSVTEATVPETTVPETTVPETTVPEETQAPETEHKLSCHISISCETILDNMEDLEPGKAPYVPEDGWILSATAEFTEGETVFDVLKRVCDSYGIQLEYSWTPMYNSYYVEGINNLYEFDCGSESGWMYKVNGWFPNYGCSSYTLEDGDEIGWRYTCKGLGADVGGSVG